MPPAPRATRRWRMRRGSAGDWGGGRGRRPPQRAGSAREWIMENQTNRAVFTALGCRDQAHLIEQVGKQLRGMMSWIDQSRAVKADQAVPQQESLNLRFKNLGE